ncbi:dTDP-4-dehydrorhamnose 3,5-epimerase [Gracilinema caldarium]|uniref:dTDP-4-dehydrorhamnose 3,5-epimerase n=1 Tax=Gracilinema caldarium (strain ATCC 51460 / DSM 7334 / H1) TaxID=744872 RepID=F8F2S8_GRAC1|nr:dTDP-4-dehydrorhamnose 3,5-epimerase [Gracilinema caldarium]AEJ19472.1 dTDP-4-dehydrorhamnose 3,5-epimerase [Gracilinema caldarium DSM 7334]
MPITVTRLPIEGLFIIQPKVFGDARGYFLESFNERDFHDAGLTMRFVQDNQSFSRKGVLRGLHFQKKHPQGKLVRVIQGEVYDVAVDIRPGSSTFGHYYGLILSGEQHNQFYIPPGFAHGFVVLSETALFAYKCTDYYHPEDEGGIRWNDPELAIPWPLTDVQVSAKDAQLPYFTALQKEQL